MFIDTHNHSLPEIDDGAKNEEMALQMVGIAYENGTREIVLTPHHLNGAFTNRIETVLPKFNHLKQLVLNAGLDVTLHISSEIHLVPETIEEILSGKALTYCMQQKAALIELPKHSVPAGSEKILSELLHEGITPIIAHPERNSALRMNSEQIKDWVDFGCRAQITGQSCSGDFGYEIQSTALKMIEAGLIHTVASDAHRPNGRSPNLKGAFESLSKAFDEKCATELLYENPKRLIEGLPLKPVLPNRSNLRSVLARDKGRAKPKVSKKNKTKNLVRHLNSLFRD